MATAMWFVAQARATARTACGAPMALGDLGVGGGRADRDAAERVPHAVLERGAADVERQVESL